MSQHEGLIQSILENKSEDGSALLMSTSKERVQFVGTIDAEYLLDFLETMFRMQPKWKGLFQEAIDRSEVPVQ